MAKARKSRKKSSAPTGAARPKARRVRHPARDAQLAFEAIAIEGGLLSPDWLARAAQLQAGGQTEADYHIPKGLQLRDEIGRYWRIAQALWTEFSGGRDASTTSEEQTQALAERFVLALLRESFGFGTLAAVEPVEVEGRSYAIGFCALDGRVPLVIAPAGDGLDTLSPAFGDGSRRRSAFGLCQEFLNAEDGALWGLVSDGVTLRIARDNASLTRPAWIEADLGRIFTEERYADFAALWLLVHETRFGRPEQPVTECSLEMWRDAGREEGTRAREHLRHGVEEALVALGQGFLSHPENRALRAALADGSLTKEAYFQELLRLVYRLIFLLTVEERGVLHPNDASESARKLYADGYSLRRLRERSVKRSAHDRFHDHWEAVKIVLGSLASGEPRLGLPALAGLFAKDQCPNLDTARLENRRLLLGLFRLSWLREQSGLSRVNWRDMGPEELGSVYESLLELVPQIAEGGREFGFATGAETKGHARKTTGSYYTPDSLVQVLLDSALEPVVEQTIAEHPGDPVDALLALAIVDPACGSGHFLLAAARRLAAHVARLEANGTPSTGQYRHALREVVGRCIYGVDLNPMAVELCKVGLWMEAVEPGLPLTFLDSHIRQGNALLGSTPGLMEEGIPNDAWKPIVGDDKKVAGALKTRNKRAAHVERGLDTLWSAVDETDDLRKAIAALESASDADVAALTEKESRWQELLDSRTYQHRKLVADAWCAAFVWPKRPGPLVAAAPTNELWRQIRDEQGQPPELMVKTVNELATQYGFFHWHLAFPQVFARGGFDVVLGNPPWERVKLQEKEFFAERSPQIAGAANAAARKRLIAKLPQEDPRLWEEWCEASRKAGGESHSIRQSGRYPLCGRGDINTFAVFAEHNRDTLNQRGRAGFIVPTGIATDASTQEYFGALVKGNELSSLYSFENEEGVFPGVHHAFKFALLTIERAGSVPQADLLFFARQVSALSDRERHFSLMASDFSTLNPNTHTCPTFRSRRDADVNLAMYRRVGILWRDHDVEGNPWKLRFMAMFHMANDSGLFRTRTDLEASGWRLEGNHYVLERQRMSPLIEAKMVHHFDHRFGTYENQSKAQANQGKLPEVDDQQHGNPLHLTLPKYWLDQSEIDGRFGERWVRGWMLGWRKIARSTDRRTLISSLTPAVAAGDSYYVITSSGVSPALMACLNANLCALSVDYAARQKVGGSNIVYHTFKQLPILRPEVYDTTASWTADRTLRDWLVPRVLELAYTAWDLQPFGRDVGYDGAPFRWDPERRFVLRAELDAAFFHLYGLGRDDVDYIMETFPIVRRNDENTHGEFRTKRLILEIYDAMTEAMRTGEPYETRLDPPPAAASVAHSDKERVER